MQHIVYKETKDFSMKELERLFLSVEWSSGKHPDKLKIAMKNSHSVYSAWDNDKLIGLMNCLSDGVMTAYFHYLLVDPEYQGKGVGKKLIEGMRQKYDDYLRKVLIAYNEKIDFYEHCGFEKSKVSSPMAITDLET